MNPRMAPSRMVERLSAIQSWFRLNGRLSRLRQMGGAAMQPRGPALAHGTPVALATATRVRPPTQNMRVCCRTSDAIMPRILNMSPNTVSTGNFRDACTALRIACNWNQSHLAYSRGWYSYATVGSGRVGRVKRHHATIASKRTVPITIFVGLERSAPN